ncbi:hypothetical protein ACIPJD_07855 [Pseudomonas aeruginosa]
MSDVTRYNFDTTACWYEHPDGEFVEHDAYAKLAAEAQALREEVARSEQHRNDQADLIVSLRTEVAALKHSQQVLIGSRNAHRDERDAARKEVAELRMARDDFKLERDLARQNFCDEQAANYQLQAHLKACLGELSELRARVVVVPERKSGQSTIPGLHMNRGWNACLDELACLNGKTVSEGLLRLALEFIMATNCQGSIPLGLIEELRALLNQDKENGNG